MSGTKDPAAVSEPAGTGRVLTGASIGLVLLVAAGTAFARRDGRQVELRPYQDCQAHLDFVLAEQVGRTSLRQDGTIPVHHPASPAFMGIRLPNISPWHHVVSTAGGHNQATSFIPRKPHVTFVQPITDDPRMIDVSTDQAVALAGWRCSPAWAS